MPHPLTFCRRLSLIQAMVLFLATISGITGCSSLTHLVGRSPKIPVADAEHPVMDLSCIWQEGNGRTSEGFPCRGFCGQMLFVAAGSRVPAIVNGTVTIYVFDDQGTLEEQARPLSVFEFTPEQWAALGRKVNLGMSYQLFVPYAREGNHHARCSLRVKYVPVDGGSPILSQPTMVTLAGRMTDATGLHFDTKSSHDSAAIIEELKSGLQDAATQEAQPTEALPALPPPQAASPPADSRLQQLRAVMEQSLMPVENAEYTENH